MTDIIRLMRESDNMLLKAEAADVDRWKKLKHNKRCLELFLNFNIAHLQFETKDGLTRDIICTSNQALYHIMSTKSERKKTKMTHIVSEGIHTEDKHSVLTLDLIDGKPKTVMLKDWKILNFISITPSNVLVLDRVVRDIVKKMREEDALS